MILKIIFAGLNFDNDPDLTFCKVKITDSYWNCTEMDEYFDKFVDKLIGIAEKELNFDAKVVYFERDGAFKAMEDIFVWETASVFDLSHLRP